MKRFWKHLVLGTAAVCALAVPTLAADFTHCADDLSDMGLFHGDSGNYALDEVPTRMDAGVMLVRLLGAEEEANANTSYTAPFTDVPDWAKPYAQYLYDHGLTNGVSATLYGYDRPCTAQQYTTFLLRALGYSDDAGGDFTYATAMDFAREIGLVNFMNCDEKNFLRDDVAAMSYTALATKPKSGETDLLTKLVNAGAVSKSDATPFLNTLEDYRSYVAVTAANANATNLACDAQIQMGATVNGMNYMTSNMDMNMAMEVDQNHMDQTKVAYDMTVAMEIDPMMAESMGLPEDQLSTVQTMQCWYTDGYYYINNGGVKAKMPLSYEEVMAQIPTTDLTATAAQVEPLCAFVSLFRVDNDDGSVTYNLTYAPGAFNGMLDSVLSSMPAGDGMPSAMAFQAVNAKITYQGSALSAMEMDMDLTTTVEGYEMGITMDMTMDNIRTGSGVTVTLPSDLNTYEELIGSADAPAVIQ